jgi:hypothetical protein
MAKKKSYEFQSRNREYNRNSDGLKQRRLKDESRWRYNPSVAKEEFEDYDDEFEDYEEEDER